MSSYRIKILSHEHFEEEYLIDSRPLLIGRSHSCDIHFSTPDVSGRHIEIYINKENVLEMRVLSMRQTLVNDRPVCHDSIVLLNVDDVLQLGSDVIMKIIISDNDNTLIYSDETAPDLTVVSNSMNQLSSDSEKTVIVQPTIDKTIISESDSSTVSETVVMHTQIVTPEELEILRRKHNRAPYKKFYVYLIGTLIAVGIIAIGWICSATNKEKNLTYPGSIDGNFNDEIIYPVSEIGREFCIYFPRHSEMKIIRKPNYILAETKLGNPQEVPFRIEFFALKSLNNLYLKREAGIKKWMEKMIQKGGKWNFDSIAEVRFRGKNNGLPYQTVKYSRMNNNESWFGIALYFKYVDWEFILLKEIPTTERWRGEGVLERESLISVSPSFIESHWEIRDNILRTPIKNLLAEAQSMLDRTSPAMWPQIYEMLVSVMIRSIENNDIKNFYKAQNLLRNLRKKQTHWLNSQKIEYFNALAKKKIKDVQRIRENCRFMFSDENDQRFHFIRKDQWE